MPTLAALKWKWFILMDGNSPYCVPCRRHTEIAGPDALSVSTDGNTVVPLIDGKEFMTRWHTELAALHDLPGAELLHTGWRFEGVKTMGESQPGTDALDDLEAADSSNVKVLLLACANLMNQATNKASVIWLAGQTIFTAFIDDRFPPTGSNHFKFAVMKHATNALALMGSMDISKTRWDTPSHDSINSDRAPILGKQTHDTGVAISGPAVADIEKTFRERWNDGTSPSSGPRPWLSSQIAASPAVGTHSVQVLRTYGITSPLFGYSWSPRGEFTVWASYLNAIQNASTYIYIEDQYFLPFDWQPCHTRSGAAQCTDIIYQLGRALKRGVRIAVLTPSNAEDKGHKYQKYQRDIGINYLISVMLDPESSGEVVVASLENITDVYIHSKLMIVDDEFVSIGSANVAQRSMTHDGEIQVGIVDADNAFAREFRMSLWAEHTGQPRNLFEDPVAGYSLFSTAVRDRMGHLKPYPHDIGNVYPEGTRTKPPPIAYLGKHSTAIRSILDPYAGPAGLR